MGTIKDRNSKDITEAEEINNVWQEYTEELYKKKKKKVLMNWVATIVWSFT